MPHSHRHGKYRITTVTTTTSIGDVRNTYTIPAKNARDAIKHIESVLKKPNHKLPEKITGIEKVGAG